MNHKSVAAMMSLIIFCGAKGEALSSFAEALQTIVSPPINQIDVLKEIKKLPQAPTDFPVADHFTQKLFVQTMDDFIALAQSRLKKAEWLGGGTKDYVFVRKLVVPSDSVIAIRGDLHGDVHSLIRWLDALRETEWLEKDHPFKMTQKAIKHNCYIAFLGDYVDRGHYGAEVMYVIMQLFINNPDNILIVRGNHEDVDLNSRDEKSGGGFLKELIAKFPAMSTDDITKLVYIYAFLPVALFLGCANGKGGVDFIQCCHGGMEPGYNSQELLDDVRVDLYQGLDEKIDKVDDERGKEACRRTPHLKVELAQSCLCINSACDVNGFQWNDFDFFNEKPDKLINWNGRGSYDVHKRYADELLKSSTGQNSKNHVWAVFRAHQHNSKTVPHILEYGNGLYKLWSENTKDAKQWKGSQNQQWSGKHGEKMSIEKYSVWTFNVAPRTGYYENASNKFTYDTVAKLQMAKGFENWTLRPRQIPVK